jgi:amino acid adenylation domain-containing protein
MSAARPADLSALLAFAARGRPDALAVEDAAGRRLTYAELDAAARRVAHRLHDEGVRRGDRVGVCMPKSLASVASIMGILRAGAAYVPVDYSAPPERNALIFSSCGARVVLGDEPRAERLRGAWPDPVPLLVFPGDANDGVPAPWLSDARPDWEAPEPPGPDDLSYVLYTSGSTGVPKGVMHTHRSAMSFVRWCERAFRPTAGDRFSSHAPFHFDLSVLDLYVPMTAGACVVVIGEDLGKDPHQLGAFIAERRISIWYSVPSILSLLTQFGRLHEHDYGALRAVLFAGEVFPVKHLRALTQAWPRREYYNLYGPTETNVCTYFRIPPVVPDDRETPYPIGALCENCRGLVLDETNAPVPPGREGLLVIHASGPVMKGYWGDEERTRQSFHVDAAGERWYRTGDVVVEDAEGNYVYRGRRDRMVKRRGYRIELGEIESALYKHPEVREAAAVSSEGPDGVVITAFLSSRSGTKLSVIALKQFCMRHLPAYMVPDRFSFLPSLPRTSTDKVDYQGLGKLL